MTDTFKPRDTKDLEQIVQWALREGALIEIVGHGSKRLLGRPLITDVRLDLSALAGITLYEPEELVLSARAGTSLAEIETLLALKSQQLAFEPMDCGPLLGGPRGAGTLGGTIAANLSGPRRIKAGSARDHVLGLTAVSGRGETFKSGGRVVKNVTGYDLAKLMTGSWGTLAALTEVTLKALPSSETEASVAIFGLDDAAAGRAMGHAMASACDVSGAAHLPAATSARFPMGVEVAGKRALTVLRLEGVEPSVRHRRDELLGLLRPFGEVAPIDGVTSRRLWAAVRDVAPFAAVAGGGPPLWRISTAPSRGPGLVARILAATPAEVLYDWAGGLIWVAVLGREDAAVRPVRAAVAAVGGSAMLFRASEALRGIVDVFDPQDVSLAALTRRVKEGFDPKGVLNSGRMWAQL